jgi:hypothetical protein
MDVSNGYDDENRDIVMYKQHGKINQQWDLVELSDWKQDPKKNEMNRDFGFKVDKDFHVVSTLGKGKYLDYLSRNLVIKTQNGKRTQLWYFHQVSRTIRSRNNNQSFDIYNSGKGENM